MCKPQREYWRRNKNQCLEKQRNRNRTLRGRLVRMYQSMRYRSLDTDRGNIPVKHLCEKDTFLAFGLSSKRYKELH